MSPQQITDAIAKYSEERKIQSQRHVNKMVDTKLFDPAVSKAARTRAVARAAALVGETVKATSAAEFLSLYKSVPAGTAIDAGTLLIETDRFTVRGGVKVLNGEIRTMNRPAGSNGWVNKDSFGFIVPSGSSNFGFEGTKLRSNRGVFFFEGGCSNVELLGNDAQWATAGQNYYNGLFIFAGNGISNLKLNRNYFHDSPDSNRVFEIFGLTGEYCFNRMFRVNDGGHVYDPGHNWMMLGNRMEQLTRMGIEIQQTDYPPDLWCEGVLIADNVLFNWRNPYWDSMGLSVPLAGVNVTIRNNFIKQNAFDGKWPTKDSSGAFRGSYGIEAPQAPAGKPGGIVEGNTIISERSVMGVSCPGKNTQVSNNKFYGPFAWAVVGGEPGSLGGGNAVESNNLKEPDASHAPAVPGGATPTPPPSKMTVKPTAFTSFVRVVCDGINVGNTVLQWRGGDGKWIDAPNKITTLPATVDVAFDPVKFKSWWLYFRLLDSVGPSAEVKCATQLGVTADPAPPLPPAVASMTLNLKRTDGTTATYEIPFENDQPNWSKKTLK